MPSYLHSHSNFKLMLLKIGSASNFVAIMGTAGLGLLWRSASKTLDMPVLIGEAILLFSLLSFAVLLSGYVLRALVLPEEWRKELRDVVGLCFTGAITISGSLAAAALLPYHSLIAFWVWSIFTTAQLVLFVTLFGRLLRDPFEIQQITPLWFVPIVGCAAVSFAGVPLGYGEFCWFMFAAALVCWLFFSPLILLRVVFHEKPLPVPARPITAILVSAPAVLALAWNALVGVGDNMFVLLTFSALFFALAILSQIGWLLENPFTRSWWALTFPSTALASTLMVYHGYTHSVMSALLSNGALAAATFVLVSVWFFAIQDGVGSFLQHTRSKQH
jgi:tellurite resistance protein